MRSGARCTEERPCPAAAAVFSVAVEALRRAPRAAVHRFVLRGSGATCSARRAAARRAPLPQPRADPPVAEHDVRGHNLACNTARVSFCHIVLLQNR